MGIRDKPIAPASPWQNGFAERLIGSIRRECVDHIVVLGEAHLRRILRSYARYYNDIRTHRSLDKDAPVSRPVQRIGSYQFARDPWADSITITFAFRFSVHTGIQSNNIFKFLDDFRSAIYLNSYGSGFASEKARSPTLD